MFLSALLSLVPAVAADQLVLTWDPNPESDVAGYVVSMRRAPDASVERRVDVGPRTLWIAGALTPGQTYCFTVEAYNTSGLASPPSTEACGLAGAPRANLPAALEDWLSYFGLASAGADDDGDGTSNAAEFARGTLPLVADVAYLTEGATGVFEERLALVNPEIVPAEVTLRYLLDAGKPREQALWLAPLSRTTVDVNGVLGGDAGVAASVAMTTTRGGAVLERTMTWSGRPSHLAAHTAKATPRGRRQWWLAEGSASWFDTWVLVANPRPHAVSVDVEFMFDAGSAITRSYVVPAESRFSLLANDVPEVNGRAFAARVSATDEVTVERAMYFGLDGALWRGGQVSPAIAEPSRTWFVAEGRTGAFFDTWLLIGNPGGSDATVTLRYLTPDGEARREVRHVEARRRVTIRVDDLPGLEDTEVSVAVESTAPIVVERSMYWPGDFTSWQEGHSSPGLTRLGTRWVLAEGEFGGARRAETYVLISNPGATTAEVSLRAVREGGRLPAVLWRTVAPGRRLTVSAAEFGLEDGERCGFLIQSTAPIAVERSVYWSTPERFWSAGTNETGTLLR